LFPALAALPSSGWLDKRNRVSRIELKDLKPASQVYIHQHQGLEAGVQLAGNSLLDNE
jgi:hypothetical protein